MGKKQKKEAKWFYIFICPWIIGFCVFTAVPMVTSLYYSFTDNSLFAPGKFVGLKNYIKIASDEMFWKALGNTFYYAVFYVLLSTMISIVIAVLLNTNIKGRRVFRTIFYIPTLVPVVVSSLLFFRVLAPEGPLNKLLGIFGITGPKWFFSEQWSKPALIVMSLWGLGTAFILLLSGLQGIPKELYEAAEIDGAGSFKELIYITVPMLSPVIFYNVVMAIINSLQVFTQTYVIGSNPLMPGAGGNGGGPENSLLSMVQLLYLKGFRDYKMGYASAIAWVLFVIILLLTMLVFKSSALWTFYEEEKK
ncbi:MAG: sugar ABC transporter permease [Lachnospiraceae bacterium]|nr:sugar ABC transporter permease [Lachnospiraceae bacterium]